MDTHYVGFGVKIDIRSYTSENTIHMIVNNPIDSAEITINRVERSFTIDPVALSIVELTDGSLTYREIVNSLVVKYNDSSENVEKRINEFYSILQEGYKVPILYSDTPRESMITYTEGEMYPTVATLELTTKCNFKCLHCYGNYGTAKHSTMPLAKTISLLNDLRNMGVNLIELTGGDISVYPHLEEVIKEAVDLGFYRTALLTNGYALSQPLLEYIVEKKEKLIVQIDLHSFNDEYWEWFTQRKNVFAQIKSNIEYLANRDVFMRIAMMITPKNLHEVERIADYTHALGIASFGCGNVINIGRSIEYADNLLMDFESGQELQKLLQKIESKYPGFIFLTEGPSHTDNCGAMIRHVTITPNGDIKFCNMDTLEYSNTKLGNVFDNNIKDIYNSQRVYLREIQKMIPPEINDPFCVQCENHLFCAGCNLRGIVGSKQILKEGGECNWYTNILSSKIREKLSL